ncbi:HNH endonuclease [Aeromicrobium fastidiosum]|uniref:HNH endonuclease n=1 Tax=Aeromicrobium fastidiosum TaxID=52699 RepID=UPI0020238471|nr:HNH endonuclease [Aeromicrobium fastidiosum]MCL8250066.1 HNH endonuclease [Aeromicrobium fastidiosum]
MSGKKKNPPVPTEFSLDHEGEELTFTKFTSKELGRIDVARIPRFRFPACPICLELGPDEAEHVPPESLGGQVMVWTCQRCNNDFGTAEDRLRSFIDLETTAYIEATDGSVPGQRAAKVALRSSEGRPHGMFIRSAAAGFEEILGTGSGKLSIKPLNMALVHASLLKHAYLAACLTNREIPMNAEGDRVRAVLLAARDRDADALTNAQKVLGFEPAVGWIEAPGAPPILLMESEESGELRWLFLLGGRFVVQWPLKDVEPILAV